MLIFTIIVTVLLVLALLFIGWIFLDGYLNPSISTSTTIENYDPKEKYNITIGVEEIGNKILRLETEVQHEHEDDKNMYTVIYRHINYIVWFLPYKSRFWKDRLNKHYNSKINKLKSKAEQKMNEFRE